MKGTSVDSWSTLITREEERKKKRLKKSSVKEWREAVEELGRGCYGPVHEYPLLQENLDDYPQFVQQLLKEIDLSADPATLCEKVQERLKKSRKVGRVWRASNGLVFLTLPMEADIVVSRDRVGSHRYERGLAGAKTARFGGKIGIDWPLPKTVLPEMATYAIKRTWEGPIVLKTNTSPILPALGPPPYFIEIGVERSPQVIDHMPDFMFRTPVAEKFADKKTTLGGRIEFSYRLVDKGRFFAFASSAISDEDMNRRICRETMLPPFDVAREIFAFPPYFEGKMPPPLAKLLDSGDWEPIRIVEFVFARPIRTERDYGDLLKAHSRIRKALVNQDALVKELFQYIRAKCPHPDDEDLVSVVFNRLVSGYRYPAKRKSSAWDQEMAPNRFAAFVNVTINKQRKAEFAGNAPSKGILESALAEERFTTKGKVRIKRGLVTVREAAQEIPCSAAWIYKMVEKGKVKLQNSSSGQILLTVPEVGTLSRLIEEKRLRTQLVKEMVQRGLSGERAVRRWIKRRLDEGLPTKEVARQAAKRLENMQAKER